MKGYWTDEWLQRLFDRYNRRYWQGNLRGWSVRWSGREAGTLPAAAIDTERQRRNLEQAFGPNWPVVLARVNRASAGCDRKNRQITVDIDQIRSDRQLRETLLHEMCHAASKGVHGKTWQREMERVIRAGGPESLRFDLAKHKRFERERRI